MNMSDQYQRDHDQAMEIGRYIRTIRTLTAALKLVHNEWGHEFSDYVNTAVCNAIEDGENMS